MKTSQITFAATIVVAICNCDASVAGLYATNSSNLGPLYEIDESSGADMFLGDLGVGVNDLASDTRFGHEGLWGVGATYSRVLMRINPAIPAIVHSVSLDTTEAIATLAIEPNSGRFFATSGRFGYDAASVLYEIDPHTGQMTFIGEMDSTLQSLAFDRTGRLFGSFGSTLVEIDPSTAAMTTVTDAMAVSRLGDMAARPDDNTMFGVGFGSNDIGGFGYSLFHVDTADGGIQEVGPSVFRPEGLAFFWAPETLAGDFDIDRDVDGADFLTWQRYPSVGALNDWMAGYGASSRSTPDTSVVSEPSGAALVFALAVVVVIQSLRPGACLKTSCGSQSGRRGCRWRSPASRAWRPFAGSPSC